MNAAAYNIYLDIDGVLLANDAHAALHVDAFVDRCIVSGADMYWLTTWCRGEENQTERWLSQTDMNQTLRSLVSPKSLESLHY